LATSAITAALSNVTLRSCKRGNTTGFTAAHAGSATGEVDVRDVDFDEAAGRRIYRYARGRRLVAPCTGRSDRAGRSCWPRTSRPGAHSRPQSSARPDHAAWGVCFSSLDLFLEQLTPDQVLKW